MHAREAAEGAKALTEADDDLGVSGDDGAVPTEEPPNPIEAAAHQTRATPGAAVAAAAHIVVVVVAVGGGVSGAHANIRRLPPPRADVDDCTRKHAEHDQKVDGREDDGDTLDVLGTNLAALSPLSVPVLADAAQGARAAPRARVVARLLATEARGG